MYASLVHLNDRMMKYVDIIVVASCAFLCFTIALQIFNRFFLQIPLPWTEEYAKYTFVWLSMFGSAKALREHSHIFVDVIEVAVKGKTAWFCNLATDAICMIFFLGLLYVSIPWCLSNFDVGTEAIPEIGMGWFYLCIPVATILMILFTIESTLGHLKAPIEYKEK